MSLIHCSAEDRQLARPADDQVVAFRICLWALPWMTMMTESLRSRPVEVRTAVLVLGSLEWLDEDATAARAAARVAMRLLGNKRMATETMAKEHST